MTELLGRCAECSVHFPVRWPYLVTRQKFCSVRCAQAFNILARARSIEDRLAQLSMPEPNSGCHLWLGSLSTDGYANVRVDGRTVRAHVVAYTRFVGPVPRGMELDHLCRMRCCISTSHLEPVTKRTNVLRGIGPTAINARKTHCNRGHPLTGSNLYPLPDGRRDCRACQRIRRVASEARKRSRG